MKLQHVGDFKVLFDRFFMQEQSLFLDEAEGALGLREFLSVPYTNVYTGPPLPIENLSSGCATIQYGLAEVADPVTYNNDFGYYTFNVTATSTDTEDVYYVSGTIYLDCGSALSNASIINVTQGTGVIDANDYSTTHNQADSLLTLAISASGANYDAVLPAGVTTTLFTVTMSFNNYDCTGQTAAVTIDTMTEDISDYRNTNSYYNFNNDAPSVWYYCGVTTDGTLLNDSLCPIPSISDISTTLATGCLTAGSFDEVTITGNNFLNGIVGNAPIVVFNNADYGDDGGVKISNLPKDILSYSQTQITMLIPSWGAPYPPNNGNDDIGPAGSGNCYVVSPGGGVSAPLNIYIHFAAKNDRGDGTRSGGPPINNNDDPLFVYLPSENLTTQWVLDSNLFATPGALTAVTQMVADINCNLGTAYTVNQTTGHGEPVPSSNYATAYIGVAPSNGTSTLAYTTYGLFSSCYFPGSTSPSIANPTGMSVDAINSVEIYIIDDGTLGYPGSSLPGGEHWWFRTDTIPPSAAYVDFASAILHELGHTIGLEHSNDNDVNTRVMYYCPPTSPAVRRTFANDEDDIQAGIHLFSLGGELGSMCVNLSPGSEAPASPAFSDYCRAPVPACASGIENINNISNNLNGFNAFLYPNPAQSNVTLHVDLTNNAIINISVVDLMGQLIMQQTLTDNEPFDISLNISDLAAGLYIVQIVEDSGYNKTAKSLKLIKIN
jgi:hypothetical protein